MDIGGMGKIFVEFFLMGGRYRTAGALNVV